MLRCKIATLVIACLIAHAATAQELFVYTEPSSNMPAKSVGIRLSNWLLSSNGYGTEYRLVPEVMWGVNKRLMGHIEGYFSNTGGGFGADGAGIYAKYRFLSRDKVYRHFRMAAFVRGSTNNNHIHQEEIMTNGHNTGYQLGLIGTQLLHKTAVSATAYYERALDNTDGHAFPSWFSDKAVNYSISVGRLIFPKAYTGYRQTNMNIMAECLGQTLTGDGKSYLDAALAVQFIFNSQTRVDVGYKRQLYSDMTRTAPDGFMIRAEHLLFNVL